MLTFDPRECVPVNMDATPTCRTVMDNITDIRDNITISLECMRAIYSKMWGENVDVQGINEDNIDKSIVYILEQTRVLREALDGFYRRMGF